uniref:Uncharacterized protein n=1 Tax=Mycena chlorophos TaxID=658473 RepID=A0ABQ0M6F5_MYCCL|nr:predicted protein [Mycena chlorophos]
MLLHPEVKIDSQTIDGTEFQLHGPLDYTVEVVQTDDVAQFINSGQPLREKEVHGNSSSQDIIMSIMEAKADSTFLDRKTLPQVVSQGVAQICRSGPNRKSIVTVLTDGWTWQFYHVRRTSLDGQTGDNNNAKRKPFAYSCTPAFTIEDPNNLAIVSKLIVAATLGHPDDFAELARVI